MGEWLDCKLEDVLTLQRGHDLTRAQMVDDGQIPVAGSNGVIGYHNQSTTKALGITIGRSGNIGNAYIYKTDFWAHNTVLYVKDFKGNDEVCIYYFLKSKDFSSFNVGSAVPTLNRNHIHPLDITFPKSLSEQKAIAEVLSSLDNKIELLHRQNKTLEALAETLFRHTFIDNEQSDWVSGTLKDVADNIRDSVKPADIDAECKYIGLEHIDRRKIALNQHGSGADVTSNKYDFTEDDILFGKLRPYFHKICLAPFSGICSTDILVIRPKEQRLLPYCLFAFFQNEVVDFANAGSGGTRMPRTNWDTLSSFKIAVPNGATIDEFNKTVFPFLEKVKFNISTIKTLENLRDTLLPKLMSGEIRVHYNETSQSEAA